MQYIQENDKFTPKKIKLTLETLLNASNESRGKVFWGESDIRISLRLLELMDFNGFFIYPNFQSLIRDLDDFVETCFTTIYLQYLEYCCKQILVAKAA